MSDALLFDPSVYSALCSELGAEDAAEVLQAFLSDTPRKIEVMVSQPTSPEDAVDAALATIENGNISTTTKDRMKFLVIEFNP